MTYCEFYELISHKEEFQGKEIVITYIKDNEPVDVRANCELIYSDSPHSNNSNFCPVIVLREIKPTPLPGVTVEIQNPVIFRLPNKNVISIRRANSKDCFYRDFFLENEFNKAKELAAKPRKKPITSKMVRLYSNQKIVPM